MAGSAGLFPWVTAWREHKQWFYEMFWIRQLRPNQFLVAIFRLQANPSSNQADALYWQLAVVAKLGDHATKISYTTDNNIEGDETLSEAVMGTATHNYLMDCRVLSDHIFWIRSNTPPFVRVVILVYSLTFGCVTHWLYISRPYILAVGYSNMKPFAMVAPSHQRHSRGLG